jgi:hypothetical protein
MNTLKAYTNSLKSGGTKYHIRLIEMPGMLKKSSNRRILQYNIKVEAVLLYETLYCFV